MSVAMIAFLAAAGSALMALLVGRFIRVGRGPT